jgi:hypothetical protein
MTTEIKTGNAQVRNIMTIDEDGVVISEKTEKARYVRQNVLTINEYGDKEYKIILQPVKREGWKPCSTGEWLKGMLPKEENEETENTRLYQSIWRTRAKIKEYALCNDWKYFFTGTFDPEKYDRFDLTTLQKEVHDFILMINKRHGRANIDHIAYLLIPEPHQNGAWHIHGLISGLTEKELRQIKLREKKPNFFVDKDTDKKLPLEIIELLQNEHELFDWQEWTSRFGWCTVEKIRSEKAVAEYVRKYVTKTLIGQKRKKGEHLFLSSHGLKRHTQLLQSYISVVPKEMENLDFWDYSDENCQVKTLEKSAANAVYINRIVTKYQKRIAS